MTDKYNPPVYSKYDTLSEIRNDDSLTHTEKMSILETWAEDSKNIAEATAEGMTPPDGEAQDNLLSEIEATLLSLKE